MRFPKNPRRAWMIKLDLRHPFVAHIDERSGVSDGGVDDEDVGLGIAERAATVMAFFGNGVEKADGMDLYFACTVAEAEIGQLSVQ